MRPVLNLCKAILVAGLLIELWGAPLAAHQDANALDQHTNEDQARQLYRRSVFAHGYIHGYEDGFHEGNFDFQAGRDPRDLKRMKEFRTADAGYRRAFGSREQFRAAYRKGFATGYADALAGREFRAVAAARRAADGLPEDAVASSDSTFDRGFRQGYEGGQVHGATALRDHGSYNSVPSTCGPDSAPVPGQPQDFCVGYTRGYLMGYDDGYIATDQNTERDMTARNTK
jgi:flagellar biosynthesis/type III secretory pathway protein FliH